ncbi:MAG: class I SAM-dependent methyltransferase [Kiloniellales bacterium]
MTASPQIIAGGLGWAQRGRGRSYDLAANRFPRHTDLVTRIEAHHVIRGLVPGLWLDIGAGTGRLARPLAARRGASIVAFDPSFDMLFHGMGERPPEQRDWPRLVAGLSSDSLPFRDGVFDGAYCFGVLNRFGNWRRIVAPVHAVLKPGARFVFNNRCLDAIRLSGDHRPPDYGYIEQASFQETLASLGLTVVTAMPAHLLSPGFLLGWWRKERQLGGEHHAVANFALRQWLEGTLARLGDLEDWIRLEMALAECLPLESAMQTVFVTLPSNGGSQDVERWTAPERGRDCAARLESILRGSDAAPLMANESCLRLLCLLAPVLDHAAGEKDFLVRVLPDRRHAIGSHVNEIMACMTPSFALRMRYEALVQGRTFGQRARSAVVRFQDLWAGEK